MAKETASYISQLVATNPVASDSVSVGDDHIRMLKTVLKTQFSGLSGTTAVTASEAEMNYLDIATLGTSADSKVLTQASGVVTIAGDVKITGTTPLLTIGDAGAEDTTIVFDGNAKDFYIALDDSADKLVVGEGSTVGTNSILTITDDTVTLGDGAAVDTSIVFDGNAQDFYVALDDSADDLLVGVVPITNLEWIQKIHRDNAERGYSAETIVDTILRRMPDYINHICPQFSKTDINFQRIPTIDTSNPFICRNIPTPDESFVIIHFRKGAREKWGIDFQYLLGMINDSFMSSPTSIVVNGGKMGFAMELILTPIIHKMIE